MTEQTFASMLGRESPPAGSTYPAYGLTEPQDFARGLVATSQSHR